jgi:hypothetical protein
MIPPKDQPGLLQLVPYQEERFNDETQLIVEKKTIKKIKEHNAEIEKLFVNLEKELRRD